MAERLYNEAEMSAYCVFFAMQGFQVANDVLL